MNLIRDMARIIPKVLVDGQTAIGGIISRNVRRIIVRAVAGNVLDAVGGWIVEDACQVGVSVENEYGTAGVGSGEGGGA